MVAGGLDDAAAIRTAVTGADAVISLLGPGRDKASIEPLVSGMQTIVERNGRGPATRLAWKGAAGHGCALAGGDQSPLDASQVQVAISDWFDQPPVVVSPNDEEWHDSSNRDENTHADHERFAKCIHALQCVGVCAKREEEGRLRLGPPAERAPEDPQGDCGQRTCERSVRRMTYL